MEYARPYFIDFRPWLLGGGLLMAALAVQQAYASGRAFKAGMASRFGGGLSLPRALFKVLLLMAAGWQLLIALATPLGAPVKVESENHGADVILAVDVSSSMYAQDVQPNRLMALKAGLNDFIARLGGDRVGIVAFAGSAVIACPLTSDYETANLFLDKLDSDSVPVDGTGFAEALKMCLDGFQLDPKRGRMIVFASDGEDTLDSNASSEARRAGDMGIPIYTLGIGTPEGAYIPGRPDMFGRVMAKTYKGQPIRTKLTPASLQKIAQSSGGQFFAGVSQGAINAAYATVRSLKQGNARVADRYVRDPLYQEPLLWAIALLLLEMMISNRAGGITHAWRVIFKRTLAALVIALAGLAGMGFSLDPGRDAYNEGNALYKAGDFAKAAEAYQQSIDADAGRYQAHYNLGNAKSQLGDDEAAIAAYDAALKIRPEAHEVLSNLGSAHLRRFEYEPAIDAYQRALAVKPDDEDTRKKLNTALYMQKHPPKQEKQKKGQAQQPQEAGDQPGKKKFPMPGKKEQEQAAAKDGKKGRSGKGGQGQGKDGKGGPGQGLSQDQVRAMMNMLKNDQQRYGQAFQPLQKHSKDQPSDDPVEQMFEQMTGRKLHPERAPKNGDRKDW